MFVFNANAKNEIRICSNKHETCLVLVETNQFSKHQKEVVVLARMRMGQTRVTHSYMLLDEEQPQCVGHNAHFTVILFLLECDDFVQMKNKYVHVNIMKQLFQDVSVYDFMMFVKEFFF